MTVTIPVVIVPTFITIAIWIAAFVWPTGSSTGSYDFGPQLRSVLHFFLAVIGSLLTWLLFFAFLLVTQ